MIQARRTLLVVDDESLFAEAVRDDLSSEGLDVLVATTGAEALRRCRERKVDVVMLDQRLPDASGPDLCPALLEANEHTKIIFVTAYPNFENALAAIRAGAFDYISKPCELGQIHVSVERCLKTLDLERAESVLAWRSRLAADEAVLVGADGGFAEVARLVRLAASSDSSVLLTGETGTGKNLVARAIHFGSARRHGELIAVNCASLPESLIEAELFGFEKGSFTGASGSREGLLEMADGGTLFLDEIGEMPPVLQTRLLNVLEEKTVRRIGGHGSRAVDFRPVAATNVDVDEALRTRRLRKDLYYRLNVIRIHLPPLRDHRQDIPALVEWFLGRITGPDSGLAVAPDEIRRLMAYDWPGNLRELRNILERSVLLHRGSDLRPSALLGPTERAEPGSATPAENGDAGVRSLEDVERRHIAAAVARAKGNLTQASRALGISVSTLRRKLPRRSASTVSE